MVLPDGMDLVSTAPLFCAGITGWWIKSPFSLALFHQLIGNLFGSIPRGQQMRTAGRRLDCDHWMWGSGPFG